jgi:hypothetical protein
MVGFRFSVFGFRFSVFGFRFSVFEGRCRTSQLRLTLRLLDFSTSRLAHPYTEWRDSRSRGVAQLVARGVWDAEVGGSSPSTPTGDARGNAIAKLLCGSNSVGRVSAFQAECRGFESLLPLPYLSQQLTCFHVTVTIGTTFSRMLTNYCNVDKISAFGYLRSAVSKSGRL